MIYKMDKIPQSPDNDAALGNNIPRPFEPPPSKGGIFPA